MPGIVVVIDPECNESLIREMASSITHEEWQKTDLYVKPPIALARVHLGILNPEQQPIFNEDESTFILMDGEVYNYETEKKELEKKGHIFRFDNDAEFCLHLYEDRGENFIKTLDGSFVLVIYDLKRDRIIVANDQHGQRHLYFTKNGNRFIFSSEVKAILKDHTFKKDIDHEAIADFFAFGRILGEKTFFTRIRAIPPASIIIWDKGNLYEKRYWEFRFGDTSSEKSSSYYVDRLVRLFTKAAKKRTEGKRRLGVFLSGGLDSRTVAAAVRNQVQKLSTFTYGLEGGDEVNTARKVAESLGAEHHFVELRKDFLAEYAEKATYLTDGMLPCAHIWWMSLLETARKNVDIVFHGTSLDILLGTYLSRVSFRHSLEKASSVFLEREISRADSNVFMGLLFSSQNSVISSKMAPLFYSKNYYAKIRGFPLKSFKRSFEKMGGGDAVSSTDHFFLKGLARQNLSIVLIRDYVEDRILGFDYDFFDFALKIPPKLRLSYKLYYRFLTRLAPDIADLPYQRTGVPPKWPMIAHQIGFIIKGGYKLLAIKLREKTGGKICLPQNMGYPELDQLIRTDSRTRRFFEGMLLNEKTLRRNYFNRDFIVRMVNEHMTAKRSWGMQLCTLLTFELWNRLFVDSNDSSAI